MTAARHGLRRRGSPDYFLMIVVFVLVVFGLVMLSSASSHLGRARHGNVSYFLEHQLLSGLLPGLGGFVIASLLYYRRYERFATPFLVGSLVLLLLMFTPFGVRTGGALRWIAVGPVQFQPSELLKLSFVMYLAAWLARPKGRERTFVGGLVPFLVICGIVTGILFYQRSTSIAVLLVVTAFVVYFASGARLSYVVGSLLCLTAALALVITVTPYRRERILHFLMPDEAPLAGGYHLGQALISIGSGGLTGVGYGQSTAKIRYLPEPMGDSIFAIIAEELGFVGAISLLALLFVLVLRICILAAKTRDRFAHLLLIGFASLIAIQTLMNVGAISGLLPLTGVPLPFVSFGGTALTVFLTMMGVVVNISRYV